MTVFRMGCVIAAVWVIGLGAALPVHASFEHHYLFSELGAVQDALPKGHPVGEQFAMKRARTVELSSTLTGVELLREGDVLTLNLFGDAVHTAQVDRVSINVNGTVSVRARIVGSVFGFALLSTTDGRTLGSVEIPETGEHYHIQSGPDGKTHYLLELDPVLQAMTEQPCSLCDDTANALPFHPLMKSGEGISHEEIAGKNESDLAAIDVMIVYTPAARAWGDHFGGGMDNVVAQSMERANLTLFNSDIGLIMPLVHSAEVDYTESGCMNIDLRRLGLPRDSDPITADCDGVEVPINGFMEEVHDWRAQYGADLVALLGSEPGGGGIAYSLNSLAGRPNFGFSVTRVQQAASSFTFIHELGHNMGAGHHKEQNVGPGPLLFSYSAGWRWTGEDEEHYATVMTYQSGSYYEDGNRHSRVAHFSDPDINYSGVPTGHPEDGNNARTLRETKHIVSAYRPSGYDHAVAFQAQDAPPVAVIQGDTIQLLMTGDSTTPVTAYAPSSWPFIEWRLDGEPFSGFNPLVVADVNSNMLITAHFDTPNAHSTNWDGSTVSYGNMFDLEVSRPLIVTGLDVRLTRPGSVNTIEVYLREGTSFGAENSSDGWTLADRIEGVVSGGSGNPSHVDIPEMLLLPDETYGIYVHLADSSTDANIRYGRNGPTVYTSPEMTITTNCAKGEAAFSSPTRFPRDWNGTVYYYVIEPPEARSIVPLDAGPTNADSLAFLVEFSSEVFNFDSESALIIEHEGTAYSSVDINGSGDSYTVTIGGITGDGTIALAVNSESDVVDGVGQGVLESVTSEPVVIDNTPPNVVSITPLTPGPTNNSNIGFVVSFDEAVQGIDGAADIIVTHDGTAHDGVLVVGNGSVYTVTVNGVTGDGTFTLAVNTEGQVRDLAGNALASGVTSAPVLVDNTPPVAPIILTDYGNGPGANFTTGLSTFELSGTAADDVIEIRINGLPVPGTFGDGQWTAMLNLTVLGPIAQISVTAVDAAGNVSEASTITISYNPLHDADGDGLTDQEEIALAGLIPADPLDPLLPRKEWLVSAVHGDDSVSVMDGGGTEDSPWRTIARAMEELAPLARAHFPLRILLDDEANTADDDGPVALYEESALTFISHVAVEPANPGGGRIHIRPASTGSSPVIQAAAHSALRGVTVRSALAEGPARVLLRIDEVPFTVERVVLDGEMQQGSTGIHVSGQGASGSVIRHNDFRNLGTGLHSVYTGPAVGDNNFEDIAANGAASRAIAIRFGGSKEGGSKEYAKQAGPTPALGRLDRIQESGFNRFRGLPPGARAIAFIDAPFDITLALYNDWGAYSEEEIRALLSMPPGGNIATVIVSPFIPADRSIEPGGVTGLILDEDTRKPIALPLGPGVEAGMQGFRMADEAGIFSWNPGELPGASFELLAKALGYADSGVQAIQVLPGSFAAPRFLLTKSGAPALAVSPLQVMLPSGGGSASVTVSNSGTGGLHWDGTVTVGTEWLSLQKQDGALVITATRNRDGGERSGSIQVTSANATNGPVTISVLQEFNAISADINLDGVVNAIDVQLVINAALGLDIGDFNADVNGDGVINAIDVQLVTNAALGIDINK